MLSSNPGAAAKLFLDFDGHFEASWGSSSNVVTPAYDQDGDATTFSSGEIASIQEIWARVAEDYAPFNIDVTTIDPGNQENKVVAVVAIGGHYSDWYGAAAGGVAYIGGFYTYSPNVAYVFEDALGNGNPKYVAEAASHEAGHLFGLQHQSVWSGGSLVQEYNPGNGDWAPIMGSGYNAIRTTWHNGPTPFGESRLQDNIVVLSNSANGFGQRADDYGNTIGTASNLPTSGTSVNFAGLIGHNDQDVWSFTSAGGAVSFVLAVAQYGPNLDAVLELLDAAGNAIVTANPAGSLGASISTTIGAGTFYLVARSSGGYGNMGQYTITGTLPAGASAPEIAVQVDGSAVADGGTVNFGSTNAGTSVTKTFTVTNTGNATLTLTSLSQANMPAGYTLVANLGSTSLAAGASTTFSVRLDAGSAGTFNGSFSLVNDDADENPYDFSLTGVVNAVAPEIHVLVGGTGIADGGSVNYGSTTVGTTVTRTFTVRNDGNATLTLTSLSAGNMPAGFTLTSNLGSTSLAPGATTTFSIRFDASAVGTFGGTVSLVNNDSDENPYDLVLSATANAASTLVKRIIDNGATGHTLSSGWTGKTGLGFEGDIHTTSKGNGSRQSNWTFNGLPSGDYNVWVTYTVSNSNASNAPFSFYTGNGAIPGVAVNQKQAPTATADGAKWRFLRTITVNNGWAQIRLTNKANGTVVADAVRLVQISAAAPVAASPLVVQGTAPSWAALAALASSGRAAHPGQPDAVPLATTVPLPTAEPTPAAARSAAHEQVWSQPGDVAAELSVLEEATELLASLRTAGGCQSGDNWSEIYGLSHCRDIHWLS